MSSVYLKIKSFGDIVALLHIILPFSCFCPLSLFLLFSYEKTILGAHLTDHHFISFTLVGPYLWMTVEIKVQLSCLNYASCPSPHLTWGDTFACKVQIDFSINS